MEMTEAANSTVLVCGPLHEDAWAFLRERRPTRALAPNTRQELMAALGPEVGGLVMGAKPLVDGEVMDQAPNLKAIGRKGVGVDNIDLEAARVRGIAVVYTPLAPLEPVAELTLGLLVALGRYLVPLDRATRAGDWGARTRMIGPELRGKTLGLVGFGRIGQRVAELVQPLGMRVLYSDVVAQTDPERRLGAQRVDLPTLFRESDWVSVHVPLTEGTRGLIGRELLGLMKPTAYFINVARGPVVDEGALIETLQARRIAGAAVDVFAEEPPAADNPLLHLENTIVTPHVGGFTQEGERDMGMVVRDVVAVLEGRTPQFAVVPPPA